MPNWFYEYNRKSVGPIPQSQMHEWAIAGSIGPDQLVRPEDSEQWQEAAMFMELWKEQSQDHALARESPPPSIFPMLFCAIGAAAFVMMVTWIGLTLVALLKMIPFVGPTFIAYFLVITSTIGIVCLGVAVGLVVRIHRGIVISAVAGLLSFALPYTACVALIHAKADIVIDGKPRWLLAICIIAAFAGSFSSYYKPQRLASTNG